MIQEGIGDYTPISFSDIPRLFASGEMPIDVALIQVTPPDKQGRCSLGISVDIVKAAAANAGLVIAQVNPQMPWTLGDSFVSVYDLDILVPVDEPLIETPYAGFVDDVTTGDMTGADDARPIARAIGENVASLVEDGSTIEIGIGRIPHAVAMYLMDKKDLGIHTEVITDAVIRLVEAGVVTGAQKSRDRGKIVTSFAIGTKELYDYIDNNPMFSFNPTEYVNDPVRDRLAEQDGGHQHRAGGGPHRPGVRRLAGHQLLLGHRRPGRLQPGRRPLGRRPGHHRPALAPPPTARSRASCPPSSRAPAW